MKRGRKRKKKKGGRKKGKKRKKRRRGGKEEEKRKKRRKAPPGRVLPLPRFDGAWRQVEPEVGTHAKWSNKLDNTVPAP